MCPASGLAPVISIVTPTLNGGRFLEQAIGSVLAQDYPHREHLVMDGGSTDGSLDILRGFESRLAYWESRPDRGQSHAINKGLIRANGDVVAWLNADDVLLPGALARVSQVFASDPRVDMVVGAGLKIDEQGATLKQVDCREFDPVRLHTAYFFLQPASFWRRASLLNLGYLDQSLHFAMDWELALRAHRRGMRIVAIPERLACLRMHAGTKTATGGARRGRELARIGRRANGVLDPNFIAHLVLNAVSAMGGSAGARARVRALLGTLYARPFMVA